MSSAKKFMNYMVVAGGNAKGEGGDADGCATKREAISFARKLLRAGWSEAGITVWKMYDDDSYTRVPWKAKSAYGKRRRAYSRRITSRELADDLRIAEANLVAARAASDLSGGSPLAAANARDAHEALYDVQQAIKEKSRT
jgi:hypothetical protein